jgi:hypothetical protein
VVVLAASCSHDRDTAATGSDRSASDNSGRAAADQNASTPSTVAVAQGPVILRQGPPPWTVPASGEEAKAISTAGLAFLHAAGQVQHSHTHLDIVIDGQNVPVPPQIGFDLGVQVQSPILTRDGSGIIHVESPTVRTFTLGQFFTEWEVRLTPACIGSMCSGGSETVHFYLDGAEFKGDPNNIALRSHQEIAIIAGPADTAPSVPSNYNFPNGY